MSSVYFEPRIWVSKWLACSPAHAALSASRASLGSSLSSAAAAVSPVDNAAKNRSPAGAGPSGRGVQAETAAVVTSTAKAKFAADASVIFVAIEADVKAVMAVAAEAHRNRTVIRLAARLSPAAPWRK